MLKRENALWVFIKTSEYSIAMFLRLLFDVLTQLNKSKNRVLEFPFSEKCLEGNFETEEFDSHSKHSSPNAKVFSLFSALKNMSKLL